MLTGERVTSRFLILPLVFLFSLGQLTSSTGSKPASRAMVCKPCAWACCWCWSTTCLSTWNCGK
jgi:hypothetical protein